jgi:hypothetical protein
MSAGDTTTSKTQQQQKEAARRMDAAGERYTDFGYGFHVVSRGVFMAPAEIIAWLDHWRR